MAGTGSTLTHLEGSLSGVEYPADEVYGCDPVDDRPLLARYDLASASSAISREAMSVRRGGGMWRWREILPVRDADNIVYLGEGDTPVLPQARLGKHIGLPRLCTKAEGLNPTGSFKARGMAAAVSRAVELGATSFIAPSAGNAGGALAAYGAAAGAEVTVVVPSDTPQVNIDEAVMMGANVVLVDGVISDCGRVAASISEDLGAFDVSTLKEPYRVEGKKTMGLELAEQYGWKLPDIVVYPTGGGTGLVGMWKAFDELERMGMIGSGRPRMVAVQTEGCAPIVRAFERGERFAEPWSGAATRASGLRVPSAVGDFLILDAIRASGGTAVAVSEDSLTEMQSLAGRLGAGYISPESAAALAAVSRLKDSGHVSPDDEIVVFDCGIGQKYPAPHRRNDLPTVDPDDFDAGDLIRKLKTNPT